MKTRLAMLLLGIGTASCSGGGGGGGGVATLFSDDFSSGLSSWTVTGSVTSSSAVGNPAPAMSFDATDARATSSADFAFTSGLTVSFDASATSSGLSNGIGTPYGGINSGNDATPAQGAGFVLINNQNTNLLLNGSVVFTTPGSWQLKNYKVQILPDGHAKYFINDALVFESVGTVSFTSPREVLLMGGPFGSFVVDNVRVTAP